jgi:hypothetical protein
MMKCHKKGGGLVTTEVPPFTRLTPQKAGKLFGKPNTTSGKLKSSRTDKEEILTVGKLNQDNSADKIRNYKHNWLHRVNRKENNRLPNYNKNMIPMEKNISRPRRRWRVRDHLNARDVLRTGLTALKLKSS